MRLKEVSESEGYTLNKILPTMSALRKDGKIGGVMTSNAADLLYGNLPGHEETIQEILDTFSVREINDAPFRFCGKEVKQSDDMSFKVTAKENTDKIRPIVIGDKRKARTRTLKQKPHACGAL